ncbi:hypothetical protein VP01_1981g10 [Puccinia sorghi]|uniref:Uncharacterized protein n=1 Tax=Puccinia sorghi TaxID=27349 RepID=A0A0L6VBL4_9BASI|nr:hypothetical protein VP01_1981g10 [Puccinia sorghi]
MEDFSSPFQKIILIQKDFPPQNTSSFLHPAPSSAQRSSSHTCLAPIESTPPSQQQTFCAKAFLPQCAIEWVFVQDWYNVYSTENNWAPCNLDTLKMKFQALVNHAKPTGNPNFPTYLCDAVERKAVSVVN